MSGDAFSPEQRTSQPWPLKVAGWPPVLPAAKSMAADHRKTACFATSQQSAQRGDWLTVSKTVVQAMQTEPATEKPNPLALQPDRALKIATSIRGRNHDAP